MEVSMQEAQNTKVVQDAYAAFGRGDVEGILDRLDDDVVWRGVYGAGPHVPTAGERRGKAQVAEFFKQVAQNVSFSRFEPTEFIASGSKVVALGHYAATTPVGKAFDSDFAMVFTLRNGKVTEFQEFTDSAAVNAAYAVGASV
jgi:ketosteroid isomerase-like protein